MASEFAYEVITALEPEALARRKGGVLRRFFEMYHLFPGVERFTRAAYMTAIGEVAEEFTAEQREAWRRFGTLPDGFWENVEQRAREWDSLH